jgi:hypothetical protein
VTLSRGIAAIFLVLAGCADAPTATGRPPEVGRPSAAVVDDGAGDTTEVLRRWLAGLAVYDDNFTRRVFYTWTTSEQVAELEASRVLLTRVESPERGVSQFQQTVDRSPHTSLARLLLHPGFARRRFAWVSPWPTVRGFGAEVYGSRLVHVRIRENAVVASVVGGVFRGFWGPAGAVPEPDVLREPERLAAVYHSGVAEQPDGAVPFREFVLCNEAAIEAWSVDTEDIAERVRLDREMLTLLRDAIARGRLVAASSDVPTWRRVVSETLWRAEPPRPEVENLYGASLAFLDERYAPAPARIDAILGALAARPPGRPLSHRPTAAFDKSVAIPAHHPRYPPKVHPPRPCVRLGTMGCVESPRKPRR